MTAVTGQDIDSDLPHFAAVCAASGESNQFIAVICPDAKDIELAPGFTESMLPLRAV